ncbi:MAG: hypothetical protein E7392_00090 [Ruminococcaceae bacterium]|nr:hypothetical protein [Oscillospiraceae bacterium]
MNIKLSGSRWLWNGKSGNNQYLCFRQEFEINDTEKTDVILSCDTNYELWINGVFVECGQYLSLPEYKYFDKIRIDKYLRKGSNVICILVYYQGVGTFCYKPGMPGLIYTIKHKNGFINNLDAFVAESSGYMTGDIELITAQLGPTFHYDATKETNWKNPEYIMGDTWEKPKILDFCNELPSKLIERPIKKLEMPCTVKGILKNRGKFIYTDTDSAGKRICEAYMKKEAVWEREISCLEITEDNSYIIIDLESETSGYFTLDINAKNETHIDIGYGEHLDDLALRMPGRRRFAFTYKCKIGENQFTNHFRRIAGRYIQLNFTNVGSGLTVRYAGIKKAVYPVKIIKKPNITDNLHKKIYDVCINTLRECMHEHFEDCPCREQSLYGFDSRNQALFGYLAFGNFKFAAASWDLFAKSCEEDGFTSICAPCSNKLKIPSFTLMWLVALCEYIEYSKDIKTGRRYLDIIDKLFSVYKNRMINNLMPVPCGKYYWDFYDWVDGLSGNLNGTEYNENTSFNSVLNLILCLMLKKAQDASEIVGDSELAKKFKREYVNLKAAINKTFFDKEKGVYNTYPMESEARHYAQMTQSIAICSGVAKNTAVLCKKMISEKYLVQDSLCTSVFRYQALLDIGGYDDYILNEIAQVWGKMLFNGATTFYETANGGDDFDGAGSLCHGWSAVPLMVYYRLFN